MKPTASEEFHQMLEGFAGQEVDMADVSGPLAEKLASGKKISLDESLEWVKRFVDFMYVGEGRAVKRGTRSEAGFKATQLAAAELAEGKFSQRELNYLNGVRDRLETNLEGNGYSSDPAEIASLIRNGETVDFVQRDFFILTELLRRLRVSPRRGE